MTGTNKKAKPSRADLARKVRELEAQLASAYHFADARLDRFGNLVGSAAILEITTLGGRETIGPVAIRDGLSPETIQALRAEFAKSYATAIEFKPSGVK